MRKTLLWSLISRGLSLVFGLATTILVSRTLGPEGRGYFAVGMTIMGLGAQFGHLGLHASNSYFMAKDHKLLPTLLTHSLVVSAVIGGTGALIAYLAFKIQPSWAPIQGDLLKLSLIWIPVGLAYLLIQNLFLGLSDFKTYNWSEIYPKALTLLLLGALVLFQINNVTWVFATGFVGTLVCLAWATFKLRSRGHSFGRWDWPIFITHFKYGVRAYFTAILGFLLLRVDLFFIQYIQGAEQSGYYSTARTMADLLSIPAMVLASILFPRLSGLTVFQDKWRLMLKATALTTAFMSFVCLAAGLSAPWVIPLLFGKSFAPAVTVFQILIPGVFFISIETVAVQILNSLGFPASVVFIWLIVTGTNVLLNFLLVRSLGTSGAAVASSVTSFMIFALIGMEIWRHRRLHDRR